MRRARTSSASARRVLAEGGLFAFNVWDSFAHNAFARVAHETIARFFAVDPPKFYEVPFGFHDRDVLRRLLDASFFGQIDLETVELDTHSASARSFATGLVRGNPVSIAIAESGQPIAPIVDAVETALAAHGGDRPFRSKMRAVVGTARARASAR